MPITIEGYKEFLLAQSLALKTASSYCSGIRYLSDHCGESIWELTDLPRLDALLQEYGMGGAFAEIGNYSHGTARNGLSKWRDYVARQQGNAVTESSKTYLLTWNPKNSQNGGDSGVTVDEEVRWSCNSTKPEVGDRIYLIRLGVDPKGIIARGTVTEASFSAEDWSDSNKSRRYIKFKPEESRESCADGLLPKVLLDQLAEDIPFKWSTQSSGITVPAELAEQVDALWDAGRGVHSLAQCARWYQALSDGYNSGWKPAYQSRVEEIAAIRSGVRSLDKETLDWLWRDGSNGVSSVAPAFLPHSDYENSLEFLRELALSIIQDPSEETYRQVFSRWEVAKNEGLFRQNYSAVIHRVFAAVAPERYTTIMNVDRCSLLLKRLARDFELIAPADGNWVDLNIAIHQAMSEAGLPQDKPVENNLLAWRLYEAFTNTPVGDQAGVDDQDPQTDFKEQSNMITAPLNQILFGPPGTGKTYNTINKALEILEPELLRMPDVTRKELKAAFSRYQEVGQIAFVTFHQSFSYEDFVEGIRAITRESGELEYRVEAGVFAQLCHQASLGVVATDDPFEKALEILSEKMEQAEGSLSMRTPTGKEFHARYVKGEKTFGFAPFSSDCTGNIFSANYKANMDHVRSSYLTGEKLGYNIPYVLGMLNYLKAECGLPERYGKLVDDDRKPFVLIIDEINRGNISRIFGELITLIEPSKRAGASEALSTTLPYSKSSFSVPDNLYLIGTMNTADKSLAGLDIALRRRFVFEEMPPKPDLLKGVVVKEGDITIDIEKLLETMNQRIEVLLDSNHCLGHAYFMPLKQSPNIATLASIFQNQILPLLQEYFFEDWQRIAWVLNDHRKSKDLLRFLQEPKVDIEELFGNIPVNGQRRRWVLNSNAFTQIDAYAEIISGKESA